MTTENQEIEEPKRVCPTDGKPLLESAHDGHLFCAECGFRPDALRKPEDDNGR